MFEEQKMAAVKLSCGCVKMADSKHPAWMRNLYCCIHTVLLWRPR